jgi:hypothetical protein
MPKQQNTDGTIDQKVAAGRDDEFVVFHIGLRINALWKVHRWLPISLIAPRMVRELASDPDSGLLEDRTTLGPGIQNVGFVQYWDFFEDLRDYTRDSDRLHFPARQEHYEDGSKEDAAVGIWHETYLVDPGGCETVYNNMPPFGWQRAKQPRSSRPQISTIRRRAGLDAPTGVIRLWRIPV